MTDMRIAHDVVVDRQKNEIRIEGVVFPYYVTPDPELEIPDGSYSRMPATLHVGIYADNLTYVSSEGEAQVLHTAGPEAESEWAKRRAEEIVYEGLRDVIEWLGRCEIERQEREEKQRYRQRLTEALSGASE